MTKLDDRLRKAAIAVRKAADHAVPRPITKEATAMWKKPAMAFGGAVIAVALVIGVAVLVRQPPAETPIAAVTTTGPTTTASPEPTTTVPATTTTVTTTTVSGPMTGPGCPEEGFEYGLQEGLPEPVASMQQQIMAAAVACDVDTLVALGGPDLIVSFGGVAPEAFFTDAVESGEPALSTLLETLSLPYRHQTFEDSEAPTSVSFYSWPSAFGYDAWEEIPEDERDALLGLYTQEELDQMAEFGGFIGWRVGITPEGDWQFFVAGD